MKIFDLYAQYPSVFEPSKSYGLYQWLLQFSFELKEFVGPRAKTAYLPRAHICMLKLLGSQLDFGIHAPGSTAI
jgi:hypothetical protein